MTSVNVNMTSYIKHTMPKKKWLTNMQKALENAQFP